MSGNGTYSGNQTGAYVWWGGTIMLGGVAPDLLGGTTGGIIVNANGALL